MTPDQAAQLATLRHDQLARILLAAVAEHRTEVRRSGYWPERSAWNARQKRWPLFLRDPAGAIVRLFENADRARFTRDWAVAQHYTRTEVREAARTVAVALALEDAK